jgi:microcystin-dependent protein
MATVDSNTYVEPTAGTSLNNSRSNFNTSLRSLLTNFKSTAVPGPSNISIAGVNEGEQDGMLYRSATTNALYISDSVHVKSSPVGGNFTRIGIGNRVENGITALTANVATYEIGELVATVSASGALSSNARLYLNVANNGTMADFIDVGIPPTNGSVTNTMIALSTITADRIKDGNVLLAKADFTTGTGNGGVGSAATLKISSTSGSDTSIGLSTRNTSANVAIVHVDGGTGVLSGLKVINQSSDYVPVTSNLALQSAIQGGQTQPVPIVPAGSVIAWSGSSAPSGWVFCDGTAISRTTYAALFAVAGTSYGVGDGSTTFNVPDLRDRLPLGKGTNNGTLGTQTGSMSASSATTTASGSAILSLTTDTVNDTLASGTKDVSQIAYVTNVTGSGHTHSVTIPTSVVNYIIKT